MSKSQKAKMPQLLKRSLLAMPVSFALLGSLALSCRAAMESDDVGFYGSVTVQRCASAAAAAIKKGDWGTAQGEFRKAIGFDPKQEDFYFGLYVASQKMQQWDQVALALEELFNINPKHKEQMLIEYGECLYHLNRYDDAEATLKRALAKVNEPSLVDARLKRLIEKSIIVHKPEVGKVIEYKEPEQFIAPERTGKLDASEVHEHKSEKSLTYLNAFMKSESITICEYRGYEHEGPVTYYKPPKALFRIEEYLKGPPLNKSLPVKYEFHRKLEGEQKPKDWKFSEDVMPKKGSKWIVFIPNCVPIEGMFETFHGSYGIQPLNDQTLDEIHKIIEEHRGQAK